jgi:molybdopterin molybdotransferase
MRPFKSLISLDEALTICTDAVNAIVTRELLPIERIAGRVSGSEVRARISVPLADRAAMDGYAVRAADTYGAGKLKPKVLRRIETLYANSVPKRRISKGKCVEVATGTTIPAGADAVVMVEDTEKSGDLVSIHSPVHPGENISPEGEDIRKGDMVISEGEVLSPAKIGALAAIGMRWASVYRKPVVAVLTTGDEVIELGRPIRPGQVYDINAYTLSVVIEENGGKPMRFPRAPDDVVSLLASLRKAAKCDLAVFSGGSSVGEKDLIMDILKQLGEVKFHGVAVKPGKPTVFGLVGKTPVLGMPGYPTSCLSNAYMILVPMLRKMARLPPKMEKTIELPLSRRVVSAIGRTEFHTVKIEKGRAVPVYKESGAITSMANADGYIRIPANVDLVEAGETVQVILF